MNLAKHEEFMKQSSFTESIYIQHCVERQSTAMSSLKREQKKTDSLISAQDEEKNILFKEKSNNECMFICAHLPVIKTPRGLFPS